MTDLRPDRAALTQLIQAIDDLVELVDAVGFNVIETKQGNFADFHYLSRDELNKLITLDGRIWGLATTRNLSIARPPDSEPPTDPPDEGRTEYIGHTGIPIFYYDRGVAAIGSTREWRQKLQGLRIAALTIASGHDEQAPLESDQPAEAGDWPPDETWHFRPGEFAFLGRIVELKGKPWTLLKRLAVARRPLSILDLRSDIWPDPNTDKRTIRSHASTLNKVIRAAFDLPKEYCPIEGRGRGDDFAYRISPDLPERIKKQSELEPS